MAAAARTARRWKRCQEKWSKTVQHRPGPRRERDEIYRPLETYDCEYGKFMRSGVVSFWCLITNYVPGDIGRVGYGSDRPTTPRWHLNL